MNQFGGVNCGVGSCERSCVCTVYLLRLVEVLVLPCTVGLLPYLKGRGGCPADNGKGSDVWIYNPGKGSQWFAWQCLWHLGT